jgi:hypothetical protein
MSIPVHFFCSELIMYIQLDEEGIDRKNVIYRDWRKSLIIIDQVNSLYHEMNDPIHGRSNDDQLFFSQKVLRELVFEKKKDELRKEVIQEFSKCGKIISINIVDWDGEPNYMFDSCVVILEKDPEIVIKLN